MTTILTIKNEKENILGFILIGIPATIVIIMMAFIGIKCLVQSDTFILGILFCIISVLGLWVVKTFLFALMPYSWVFTRPNENIVSLTLKVFGIQIRNLQLSSESKLYALPAYHKGDWGYSLGIICNKKKIKLLPPQIVTNDLNIAKNNAKKLIDEFGKKLNLNSILIHWDKYQKYE